MGLGRLQGSVDDLDRKLISLLRRDARSPIAQLAACAGVSRGTVQTRIQRLMRSGVIQGFTVELEGADGGVRAIMSIALEGRSVTSVIRSLLGLPEVRAVHCTNGAWDLLAELAAPDLLSFESLLRRIRGIEGVSRSESSILLRSNQRGRCD